MDSVIGAAPQTVANEKGDFVLTNVAVNRYDVRAVLPGDDLYIAGLELVSKQTTNGRTNTAKSVSTPISELLAVQQGRILSGLTVKISHGAASLSGNAHSEKPEIPLPVHARLFLVHQRASRRTTFGDITKRTLIRMANLK